MPTFAVGIAIQRPNITPRVCVGALLAFGCSSPSILDTSSIEAQIVERDVSCDPLAEQWHLHALVHGLDNTVAVHAEFNGNESHPLTLQWQDDDLATARYWANLDIINAGPVQLGRTTGWSCNDAPTVLIRMDVP